MISLYGFVEITSCDMIEICKVFVKHDLYTSYLIDEILNVL